jgi:hypothetical protein
MDMRYWWLRDRNDQEHFRYYWHHGPTNHGDYFMKHCAAHHQAQQDEYFTPKFILKALCASTNRRLATSGKGLIQAPILAATAA